MLGALYIGLSGMNAYSRGLTSVSNNVSNLNTPGFKAIQSRFSESGHNGVRLGSNAADFTQGEIIASANDLDLAIEGNGFLVLANKDGELFYARTGRFSVDADGYVVLDGGGMRLATLDASGSVKPIKVDRTFDPPVASTKIVFSENLSSTATTASVADINLYDALGVKATWQVGFTPVGTSAPGEWNVRVTTAAGVEVATSRVKFSGGAVDPLTRTITITDSTNPAASRDIVLDFSDVTSFSTGTTSTIRAEDVDGSAYGALTSVVIDDNGEVKLSYDNSNTSNLGPVAMAEFRSADSLTAQGGGVYAANSDDPARFTSMQAGTAGNILGKSAEASNVNLSQEFGDLILIQRGFQASSQIVSVTNEMIQQLFGMRGNG
jgi:flagellar hook protein FlgE